MPASFVDGHYIGMVKLRHGFGFRPETLEDLLSGCWAAQKDLHRNSSIKRELAGFEHCAHSAAADFLQKLVIAKGTGRSADAG